MKSVIYLRVSDKRQAEGESLPVQEKICREYSAKQGCEVIKVFSEEGGKGGNADRKQLMDALAYCTLHKPDFFIVFKLDRFSRDVSNHYAIKALLAKYGTSLRSATEPISDAPEGKFMEAILAATAEYDNAVKSVRVRLVMEDIAKQGYWQAGPPFGYVGMRDTNGRPTLAPHFKDGQLVPKVYDLFTKVGLTEKQIANKLTAYRNKKVLPQQVSRILTNPVYYGWIVNKLVPNGVWGKHAPLIDEETYLEVQRIKGKLKRKAPIRARINPDFPVKGALICAVCGDTKKLTGSWSKGKSGKRYPYYHCTQCGTRLSRDQVEREFYKLLEEIKIQESYFLAIKEVVQEVWGEKRAGVIQYKSQLEKEIAELDQEAVNVGRKAAAGVIDDLTCKRILEENSNLKVVREIELREMNIEDFEIKAVLNYCEGFLGNLSKVWLGTPEEKRLSLLKLVFPNGLVFEKESFRTPKLSPLYELIGVVPVEKSHMVARRGIEPLLRE